MTIVNATQFNSPITIGVNTSILPNVAIDESSITYSSSHLFGRGRIYYGNYNYQASFSYYGNFNFNSIYAYENSNVYSAYITINNFGRQIRIWDAFGYSSGTYFVRVKSGSIIKSVL